MRILQASTALHEPGVGERERQDGNQPEADSTGGMGSLQAAGESYRPPGTPSARDPARAASILCRFVDEPRSTRRRALTGRAGWLLALLALAAAFAYPMQVNGYNQNAHYALVRALADGEPWIDQSLREIGEVSSGDVATYKGHVYAAKAPLLAMVSLPPFVVVEAVGMRTTGDPTRVIWALHLFGVALAAVLILVLVRDLGDRLEPGLGAVAAVAAGLGTMLLPFGTLFFSHVLGALLGFAAFALLWRERDGPARLALVGCAGALGGLAIAADYPLAIAAGIVGVYALARSGRVRRGLVYAGGALVGVLPLLAFNSWAFGSPFHIAYEDYYDAAEQQQASIANFGFGLPSFDHAVDLLFSSMGLLVISPVTVAGVAGAVLMLRRRRAEALVILGVAASYYLYNSSLRHVSAFGGLGPPRYLFPIVPFLAVPVALAFRRFPLTTLGLTAVSAFQMVVMTASGPLAAYDGQWLRRFADREVVLTAAALVGVTGWTAILPFVAAALVAAAIGVAIGIQHVALGRSELPLAIAALLVWALIALAASNPNGLPPSNAYVAGLVVVIGVLVTALAVARGAGPLFPRPRGTRPAASALRRDP